MAPVHKLDQIGTTILDERIHAVHIRKSDPKPLEASVMEIVGCPGTYRIGKTYFDNQGHRCVKVARLD